MESSMTGARTLRNLDYGGISLGKIIEFYNGEREFRPLVEKRELLNIIRDMSFEQRANMENEVNTVHRLCEHYRVCPEDYVDDKDILDYANNLDLSEVNTKDWLKRLIRIRGLEKEILKNKFTSNDLEFTYSHF